MAGDWIHVRVDLALDPCVLTIAHRLKIEPERVVGCLVVIWSWAQAHTTDGFVHGATADDLDRLCRCPDFVPQMSRCKRDGTGWIAIEDGGIRFPNWDEWLSRGAKNRLLEARKKREQRNVPKLSRECPDDNGTKTGPEERRGEKRRDNPLNARTRARGGDSSGSGRRTVAPWRGVLPEELTGDGFPEAWDAWVRYKAERLEPVTQTSGDQALEVCLSAGAKRAVAALRRAIANGWVGFMVDELTQGEMGAAPEPKRAYDDPCCAYCGWQGSGEIGKRCRACGRDWVDGRKPTNGAAGFRAG